MQVSEGRTRAMNLVARSENRLMLSAETGDGMDGLLALIEDRLFPTRHRLDLSLPHSAGAAVAWLYDHGAVLNRSDDEQGVELAVELTEKEYFQFCKGFPDCRPAVPPRLAAQ